MNTNTEREELAAIIHDAEYGVTREPRETWPPRIHQAADAVLAAGYRKPRTIATVEELDALPDGSFIITEQGGYWQADKRGHGEIWWLEPGNPISGRSDDLTLPAMVLHTPEANK